MFRVILALAMLGLAGCTSVKSKGVQYSSSKIPKGVQYSAPKALVWVELFETSNELVLTVSKPFMIGDHDATFALSSTSSPFVDEDYYFVVDPTSRLLNFVDSKTTGRLDDILVNAGQSAGGFGGLRSENADFFEGEASKLIYAKLIDPMASGQCAYGQQCTITAPLAEFKDKAMAYLGCGRADGGSNPDLCFTLAEGSGVSITLEPLFDPVASSAPQKSGKAATCNSSICYRIPAPYLLNLSWTGVAQGGDIVFLPNKAPFHALSLPSGVFADTRSTVRLVGGMPHRVGINKGNELVEVALLPSKVIAGFFRAGAEMFKLRIDYNNARGDALESDTELEEKQDARDEFVRQRALTNKGDDPTASDSDGISFASENSDNPSSQIGGRPEDTEIDNAAVFTRQRDDGETPLLKIAIAKSSAD